MNAHRLRSIIMIIVLVTFIVSIFGIAYANTKQIIIEVNALNVRSGPGTQFQIIDSVKKGEQFSVLEDKDRWYKIQLHNNQLGWVASWLVSEQTIQSNQLVKVQVVEAVSNGINVRTGPSLSFPVVTSIKKQEFYPILENNGEWIQIQLNPQTVGWVASWVVVTSHQEVKPSQAASADVSRSVAITANILNLRSGPNTSSTILDKLTKGQVVNLLKIQDGWYQVKTNQHTGWIASEYAQQTDTNSNTSSEQQKENPPVNDSTTAPPDGQTSQPGSPESSPISQAPHVVIPKTGINIRSGPGTSYNILMSVNQGDTFTIINTHGDWFEIALADSKKGFVAGWVVQAVGIDNVENNRSIAGLLKGKTIVIDPGHGGIDVGAIGSHFKTLEKELCLSTSLLLESKLKAAGSNVIMTRNTDIFLSLPQRVALSTKHKADAFISVHYNTNHSSSVNGTIVYHYNAKGNDVKLAKLVQQEIVQKNGLKDLGARQGNFYVLRENPQLSILVEAAFLSNYNDELVSRNRTFQDKVAEGIFQGVLKYFNE
ncbi:hypothetical protein BHU72_08740 [Desulfuribacillus stibiiarsenatis]|uniref:SH3b domain-containing protein n=1 Tax=Desulfuribacillus stibiiarsenatis TaxID=1390249 RepID=A0A1E5L3A0_9FIRM|nr:SH3 domain-containing protein [Desulfuribacillus stibiiarsenatis]OEH84577.1 hypothetical protein BHU72_08740 [Desulfuribacillus stibiiarsenatis]